MQSTPKKLSSNKLAGRALKCAVLILLLLCLTGNIFAVEKEEARIWAGLRLFPSFMAADMDIVQKQSADGRLLILLVYLDKKAAAEEMARYLEKIEKIRGVPIRVELTDDTSLKRYADHHPAGIFLTQQIDRGFKSIVRYGRDNHIFVFSSFEEDVERGVTGGMLIRERVFPYINKEAMHSGGIRIKPFFLRISKLYE